MDAYNYLTERKVTRLCHFTNFRSFMQILEDGILATNRISNDVNHPTDSYRYDNEPSYICCSIQFPNVWYLERTREKNDDNIFNDWVIILIKPEVIRNRSDVKCSAVNAATRHGEFVEFANINNIKKLFASSAGNFNRFQNLPDCYATNAQAEILIRDIVPKKFIYGICVKNENMAIRVNSTLKTLNINDLEIYISSDMFSTNTWRNKITRGHSLEETLFIEN